MKKITTKTLLLFLLFGSVAVSVQGQFQTKEFYPVAQYHTYSIDLIDGLPRIPFSSLSDIPDGSQGFMINYQIVTPLKADDDIGVGGFPLFGLGLLSSDNHSQALIDILITGNTLILRRFDQNNKVKYIDYKLFDKMFNDVKAANKMFELKIYFTAHLIWAEVNQYSVQPRKHADFDNVAYHSPIFWGLNYLSNENLGYDVMQNFLNSRKTQRTGTLNLYHINLETDVTNYNLGAFDLRIHAFTNQSLRSELDRFVTPQTASGFAEQSRIPLERENLKEHEDIDRTFRILPNPVSNELFLALSSNENVNIQLLDMQERILYQAEVSGTYEHTIPIGALNIGSGVFFVKEIKQNGSVNTLRVIVSK